MDTASSADSARDSAYRRTSRTSPSRKRDQVHYDRDTVHAILDADFICHMGFIADDAPVVLPTLYARIGDHLYLHGSTGSRPLRSAGEGMAVCVTVTLTDQLVMARSAMHHSVRYRSVVAHGAAHPVSDPNEHRRALGALVDGVVPGRAADCRPPGPKEAARTAVLRLELSEVSAKVRSGGVNDEPEDSELPHWAGTVPISRTLGTPVPDPALPADVPVPDYLHRLVAANR